MCYVVGLSHILVTGMVCEHKALLDAPRREGVGGRGVGRVWWDGERIKKGSSSLIPSSSGGKGWSAKTGGALHGYKNESYQFNFQERYKVPAISVGRAVAG